MNTKIDYVLVEEELLYYCPEVRLEKREDCIAWEHWGRLPIVLIDSLLKLGACVDIYSGSAGVSTVIRLYAE